MEIRNLTTFRAVAEMKGFTRAAEALGYAQSSVTAQIQTLEEELGVPLFNRLGKKIVLTDAGERLLPYVHQVQSLLERAIADVTEDAVPTGTLVIGAVESLCAFRLPALLQAYRRLYPQVKIVIRPGICWELRDQLRNGQLDVALLLQRDMEMPDVHFEKLIDEPVLLLASPTHPLTKKASVVPEDLRDETVLLTETGCPYRMQFEDEMNNCGILLDQQIEFGSMEALKQCVITGIGVAQLPQMTVMQELDAQKVVALPWAGAKIEVATMLAYHKDKWMSSAVKAFVQLTRQIFQEHEVKVPV